MSLTCYEKIGYCEDATRKLVPWNVSVCACVLGLGSDDEVRLVDHLFDGYNPLIRPVRNLTDVIDVGFNLALIQLINVVSSLLLLTYLLP